MVQALPDRIFLQARDRSMCFTYNRSHLLMVRKWPFLGWNRGSNPRGISAKRDESKTPGSFLSKQDLPCCKHGAVGIGIT